MNMIVEVKMVYRVSNVTSADTARRAVKAELLSSEPWHDEEKVDVERLSFRTVTQPEEGYDELWMT